MDEKKLERPSWNEGRLETKFEFFMDHKFDPFVNGRFSQTMTVKT